MDWFNNHSYFSVLTFAVDFIIRLWLGRRIVARRLPAGVAWAWLCLILFIPFLGTILYLNFGEYRQSRRRQRRLQAANDSLKQLSTQSDSTFAAILNDSQKSYAHVFQDLMDFAPKGGNNIDLYDGADACFAELIEDVNQAQQSIDLEFYIWSDGGRADEFAQSLCAAARRGVKCRLLVDALGSRKFIGGKNFQLLKAAGVNIVIALPSGFWRSLLARPDLRIHRKIAIVDGSIGYTGSLNLADPLFFNLSSGVSPWVDALARIRGPAVADLYSVFICDWCAETDENFNTAFLHAPLHNRATNGQTAIQCLPSGPAVQDSAIEQVLITSLYFAQNEIILTTPYFVPSEALLYALTAAARRGVRTVLIIPERIDSRLTQYASRSFLPDLVRAGVLVALYRPGLLHTKSVTIDKSFCLFGSLNLDQRSFRINFEITIAIYDATFTQSVVAMQSRYLKESIWFTVNDIAPSLRGDLARLVSPLL